MLTLMAWLACASLTALWIALQVRWHRQDVREFEEQSKRMLRSAIEYGRWAERHGVEDGYQSDDGTGKEGGK